MQEMYVDRPDTLAELCARLRGAPRLALDTEFMRERTYYAQLCLIQIATEDLIACIDPLALSDIGPLLDIIYDPAVLKVMHAARQDLEIFFDQRGTLPGPVFDTQIGAAVLGEGDQVGYGALVQSVLGVTLDKAHTRTDWSQRPLDPAQVHYAADDVRHLLALHDRLGERLRALGREGWLAEDFADLVEPTRYRREPGEVWRRIRGVQQLKGAQLAALRVLAAWREERAVQANKPRKWIVPDDALVNLARQMPRDMERLARTRGLEAGVVKRHGEALLALLNEARGLPREQWPELELRPRLSEEQGALADALMAAVRLQAVHNGISAAVLVTRADIERLVLGERDLPVLHGWRRALVGNELLALLSGERRLAVSDGALQLISDEADPD